MLQCADHSRVTTRVGLSTIVPVGCSSGPQAYQERLTTAVTPQCPLSLNKAAFKVKSSTGLWHVQQLSSLCPSIPRPVGTGHCG